MRKSLRKFIFYLISLFCLSVLIAIYVVQMTGVLGNSMEPELKDGQQVFVNKLIYQFEEPERFDVVVFRYLYKENSFYIKRVIGLPGETVQIIDGLIYIDGERLSDPFASEPIQDAKRAKDPVTLGEDEYFVIGDNRNHSSDSRDHDVGNIKKVQILGKAVLKLWPIQRIRHAVTD